MLGLLGICLGLKLGFFFGLVLLQIFFLFFFIFYSSKFVWHKNFEGVLIRLKVSFITRSMGATRRLRRASLEWGCLRTLN